MTGQNYTNKYFVPIEIGEKIELKECTLNSLQIKQNGKCNQ